MVNLWIKRKICLEFALIVSRGTKKTGPAKSEGVYAAGPANIVFVILLYGTKFILSIKK